MEHGVGKRVRRQRVKLKMSQGELARRIVHDRVTVWRIEKGRTTPTFETLQGLAKALQVSLEWLATGRRPANDNGRAVVVRSTA